MAQESRGKVALITGANKGIGFEVARQLAAQGIKVLVGARNAELGETAASSLTAEGHDAHYIELDVTRPDTIKTSETIIQAEYVRLDILVNNAGIVASGDGPPSVADADAVRRILEVNVFGVLAVTQVLLPLVRKASSGRIVMVLSGLGSITWNADPNWPFAAVKLVGYNGSKALPNLLTVRLAWELRETSIKVNTVNPGYTATDLNGNRGTQTAAEGAKEIVRQCLVGEDGQSGGFFETGGIVPW